MGFKITLAPYKTSALACTNNARPPESERQKERNFNPTGSLGAKNLTRTNKPYHGNKRQQPTIEPSHRNDENTCFLQIN